MGVVPLLKADSAADVLHRRWLDCCGLVHNVLLHAILLKGALIFSGGLAVAVLGLRPVVVAILLEEFGVVCLNYAFYVLCATVRQFEGVAVEDGVQYVLLVEVGGD